MKNMNWRFILTVTFCLSLVYCQLEVIEENVEEIIEVSTIEPLEVIMNDFTVKPFTEYPAYYVQGNAVTGIPANAKGPIDLMRFLPMIEVEGEELQSGFDTFFVVDGKPHFIISLQFSKEVDPGDPPEIETITKYCTQTAGKIEYLTEAKFPEMPEQERVTGATGIYHIDIGDYQGDLISIVSRIKIEKGKTVPDYAEKFITIDGFIEIEGGLLIHTPTGRGSSRPAGLLFWPEGLRTMNHWKEVGRFWK